MNYLLEIFLVFSSPSPPPFISQAKRKIWTISSLDSDCPWSNLLMNVFKGASLWVSCSSSTSSFAFLLIIPRTYNDCINVFLCIVSTCLKYFDKICFSLDIENINFCYCFFEIFEKFILIWKFAMNCDRIMLLCLTNFHRLNLYHNLLNMV